MVISWITQSKASKTWPAWELKYLKKTTGNARTKNVKGITKVKVADGKKLFYSI